MKKIIFTLVCVMTTLISYGQQERQYTQFMYNKLSFNPGYAGSYEAACLTGIYRNQWIGLDGAPRSISLSFDAPLNNERVGVGLNLHTNKIGITNTVTVDGSYAYRLRLGKGTLGIGLQASVRYFSNNYADERLQGTQDIGSDGGIPIGRVNKYLPNFGAGLYYQTPMFYAGFSAPRLLSNNIDFSSQNPKGGKESSHLYAMSGVLLPISKKVQIQPQLLVKFVSNAPVDLDFNLNFIFNKKFTVGGTYRTGGDSQSVGESIDLIGSAFVTDNLMFGLSYDITLSGLRDYSSGSFEAVVRYCFGKPGGEDVINPRFF